jgi:hypothetical protein
MWGGAVAITGGANGFGPVTAKTAAAPAAAAD